METEAPLIPQSLLDYLDEKFPDRLPRNPLDTLRDVHLRQGQRQVIAHLIAVAERQREEALDTDS